MVVGDNVITSKDLGTLHSVDSVARISGKSHWCIRWRIRNGWIRPIRLGRRLFITSTELLRVLEETQGKKEANH